jgi:hypothetical protein
MESHENKENSIAGGCKIKFNKDIEELKDDEVKYIVSTDLFSRVRNTMELMGRI